MPQPQAYTADNKPIADADLARALDAGEAHYDPGTKISVIGAGGETWEVPVEELGPALARGFKVEGRESVTEREARGAKTQAQLDTLISPVELYKGYMEGLHRLPSLGLSDQALVAAGADPAAMARRASNPATIVPEVGGAIAGTVLGTQALGAAGVLGRGAQAAVGGGQVVDAGALLGARLGGGVAGRAIGYGVAGAGEGAVLGAGSEVSRAALEQRPVNAEKLALSGLYGGLLGTAGGALGSVATDGMGALIGSIGRGRSVREIADDFATSGTLSSLGATKAQVARLKDPQAATRTVLNYKLKSGPEAGQSIISSFKNTESILPRLKQARDEVWEELKGAEQLVSSRLTQDGASVNPRAMLNELRAAIGTSESPAAQRAAKRALKEYDPLRKTIELEDLNQKLKFMGDSVSTQKEVASLSPVYQAIKARRDQLLAEGAGEPWTFERLQAMRREIDATLKFEQKNAHGMMPPSMQPLERANNQFRRQIGEMAERALGAEGVDPGVWRQVNDQYGHINDLFNIASKEVKGSKAKATLSAGEKALGVAAFITTVATGSPVAALTAGALGVANRLVKEYGGTTLAATMRQIQRLDRRTNVLAHSIVSGESKALAKGAARRVQRTLPVAALGQAERFQTDGNVTAHNKARFVAATRSLIALQDPVRRAEVIGAVIAPIAEEGNEELAMEVSFALSNGIDRLAAKLPLPLQEFSMQAHLDIESLDGTQINDFLDSLDMLNDPVDALAAAMDGDLDPMAVELLKEQQPFYWNELRGQIAQELAETEERIPYERGLRIALDFDLPEPSLEPEYLFETQQTFAQRDMMVAEAGGAPSKPLNMPKDTMLETDKILGA